MGTDPRSLAADDLAALLGVARDLGIPAELTPLLERLIAAAVRVLDCERASVFLYDAPGHELYSKVATGASAIRFSADAGIAGEAVRTGKIINVPDAYADERFNRTIDAATGFRTRNLLTLPLHGHDGQLVGVLQTLNHRRGSFGRREEELASALAALAGVAIQRQMLLDEYAVKLRLERDLELARRIQQSLLPKDNPRVPGFDLVGFNRPADQTGGDCYDYVPLPSGRIALLLADATGHGIGPALLVSQLRAMVRALLLAGTDIAECLLRTNDLLVEDLPGGLFVTVFLGVLDPAAGTIRYVSAGHGPLLWLKSGPDQAVELPATTLPLGIISPLDCPPAETLLLGPGDVFLPISDGFFEWANPGGEQFGTQRIFDILRKIGSASAANIIPALLAAVHDFSCGTPQADDLTAIVIRRVRACDRNTAG